MVLSSVEFEGVLVCPVLLQLRGERRGHFSRFAIGDNLELPDGTIPPGVEQTSMHGDPGVEQSMPPMKIGGSAQNGAGDAAHSGGDHCELPDAKDNDIDGHLEGDEQADRIEKALQLEQFQLEEEEMAPEPSDGRKGTKESDDATQREKGAAERIEAEERGVKPAQWMSLFGISQLEQEQVG